MDLFGLLTSQLFSQDTLGKLAQDTNMSPNQVEKLTKVALPTMLEALNKNASSEAGKQSLDNALAAHQDDLSNLTSFFDKADPQDGDKILNHMFGAEKDNVTSNLAKQSGLDVSSVISLLVKYAPMLLTLLATTKMTSAKKTTSSPLSGFDLSDILGGLLGQSKKQSNQPDLMDGIKDILGGFLK